MTARQILAAMLMVTTMLIAADTRVTSLAATDLYAGVLPDLRETVEARVEGELSAYELTVKLDPSTSTIGGRERVTFVNRFAEPLVDVAFRLYPNAFYYDEGGISVDDVRVAGKAATVVLESDETAMRVPLPEPLAPGASVNLSFRFRTVIPTDSDGTYGIFSHDTIHGTWVLADWYPIIAGWEAATGWRLDEPTAIGDPTFSDAALYDVTVTAPADLTVVATGTTTTAEKTGDQTVSQFVSGPAREFTLVADDDYTSIQGSENGTTVRVYVNPDTGTAAGAEKTLETAINALRAYSARYGAYPYGELDVVETNLAGALGVSWAGLIFLDGGDFLANSFFVNGDPSRLDFTVAHEVGHQWWGGSVGANSNDHSFLIEGLTNYLATVYVEDSQGESAARRLLAIQIAQPYLAALDASGDGVVDVPITAPAQGPSSGALQYGKAALGFLAIREEIGDTAFFAALADYADDFAFSVATPDDLLSEFEQASGKDLDDLWRFWFNEAATTRADVEQLLAAQA
jgi:hypothetical protein